MTSAMVHSTSFIALAALLLAPLASAQSCISLAGSTQCPAFSAASISTDSTLRGFYPFLQFVSSREDFDTQLGRYLNTTYVQTKYQQLLGCANVQLTNTTSYYARYTTSVICNAIVQNSIQPCGLTGQATTPLCADSCATYALNEEEIVANQQLCNTTNQNYLTEVRADFTNCALPTYSLDGSTCIPAERNEPDNCGFSTNLGGLCAYCAASSPNATDSCCQASDVTNRCTGVTLPPSVTSIPPLFSATAPAAPAANTNNNNNHLSGGAIAGIVIGSVAGAALLAIVAILLFICFRRRRRGSPAGSIFNQPSPRREPLAGTGAGRSLASRDYGQPGPGGRVTRMTALEHNRGEEDDDEYDDDDYHSMQEKGRQSAGDGFFGAAAAAGGAAAAAGGAAAARDRRSAAGKRVASRNSGEMIPGGAVEERDSSSPHPDDGAQATSSQSEQLPYFKDYYSSEDIHPGDRVAVLWGYQPRANDEFELERGNMLKVIGIWDDGWATGVLVPERAEDWVARPQRDSGVSNGSSERPGSPVPEGDVKAFPLVCVCLPQHWRKTIAGSDSASPPAEVPAP